MIVRSLWSENDDTITVEFNEGEPTPDEDAVLYLEGYENFGIRVGKELYNKFGVVTYEVLETGIPGSYDDL